MRINTKDKDGSTPLHLALEGGGIGLVRILAEGENDAGLTAQDNYR